jgi:hypothetical protein
VFPYRGGARGSRSRRQSRRWGWRGVAGCGHQQGSVRGPGRKGW